MQKECEKKWAKGHQLHVYRRHRLFEGDMFVGVKTVISPVNQIAHTTSRGGGTSSHTGCDYTADQLYMYVDIIVHRVTRKSRCKWKIKAKYGATEAMAILLRDTAIRDTR